MKAWGKVEEGVNRETGMFELTVIQTTQQRDPAGFYGQPISQLGRRLCRQTRSTICVH